MTFLASYWTIAGDTQLTFRGGTEVSPFDLRARIEAAAAAGYTGIGLHGTDLRHWCEMWSHADIVRLLDDNGITDIELEVLRDWYVDGEARAASDLVREELLAHCWALPVRHVKANSTFLPGPWAVDRMATELATLAAAFAETGARVGVEPIPMAHLRTPAEVLAVVEASGAANAGLLLDVWHVVRAGVPFEEVAALPAARIVAVEVVDGWAEPVGDLVTDATDHRLVCGEGDFDVPGFLSAVRRAGYDGPIGVENLSIDNRVRGLHDAATRNLDGARQVLARTVA